VTDVLVAYGSKRGSTAEIAQAIAETMREHGLAVDCTPAEDVETLEPYDAVVLGSAVYMKRWRGDAKHFLRKHRKELAQLPFWVFSSGPVGEPSGGDDAAGWTEPPKVMKEVERLRARDHVVFGGRMPTEPHGPLERSMVEKTPVEHRDHRNWHDISAWAASIASELRAAAPNT
jgi:menaquinone-dependent protoporphyrinogen oxidase